MKDFFQSLKDDHSEFDQGKLEEHFGSDPWELFNLWYKEAFEAEKEPNAMSLSTVDASGQPSSRILYLKECIEGSFVFYTNYSSDKGTDIADNNKVSILFFWPNSQRQLRIEGTASKIDGPTCDAYFASRPRGSQLGAWASDQSSKLKSRDTLEQRIKEFDTKFPNDVPRPSDWGGYSVKPNKVEFWQGRPSRLHDRIVFEKQDSNWSIYRLNP